MILAALLLAAAALDGATMLLLPPGAELNPIAATVPVVAVLLKAALALTLAALALRRLRYFRGVAVVGALAWSVGAAANIMVLA